MNQVMGRPKGGSKLSHEDLRAILVRRGEGEPWRTIAKDYNCHHSAIIKRLKRITQGVDVTVGEAEALVEEQVEMSPPEVKVTTSELQKMEEELKRVTSPRGPHILPEEPKPKKVTKYHHREIPVPKRIRGDAIRGAYIQLFGKGSRTTILQAAEEIIHLLQTAEIGTRRVGLE